MSDHLKIHKGIKSYLCDLCGRTFVLRTYLGAHKRSHHLHDGPKKSFVCNICGYAASSQSVLLIHERIHTGEKVIDTVVIEIGLNYCVASFVDLALWVQILWQKVSRERDTQSTSSVIIPLITANISFNEEFLPQGHIPAKDHTHVKFVENHMQLGTHVFVSINYSVSDATFFSFLAYLL